jgi:hypothetical protein
MTKAILIAAMSATLASSAVAENEFRHVVLFKFKPEATADKVATSGARARASRASTTASPTASS